MVALLFERCTFLPVCRLFFPLVTDTQKDLVLSYDDLRSPSRLDWNRGRQE